MVIGRVTSLSDIVRLGFESLSVAKDNLVELETVLGSSYQSCISAFETSASPDRALAHLLELSKNHPRQTLEALSSSSGPRRLMAILGASDGLADYLTRHPDELSLFSRAQSLPSHFSLNADSRLDLRVAYRRELLAIADWDLGQSDPAESVVGVTSALSRLADAALEGLSSFQTAEFLKRNRTTLDWRLSLWARPVPMS